MSNIVDDHRKMMCLSGNLSDFQLQNLSKYPMVFFENIIESRVEYDFGLGEGDDAVNSAGDIKYTIVLSEEDKDLELKKEEEAVRACAKFLFWKETKIRFNYEYR